MTRTIAELATELEVALTEFKTSELDVDDPDFKALGGAVYQVEIEILERVPVTLAEAAAQLRVILDHGDWGVDQVAPTLARIEQLLQGEQLVTVSLAKAEAIADLLETSAGRLKAIIEQAEDRLTRRPA